jgi:hypothetical protein
VLTFEEFLLESVAKGEAVNLVFEQRLFELAGTLHRIAQPLESEHIPHELIGGLAVLIHVEEADPTHAMLTRDVDLMIQRTDLPRVIEIAQRNGFRFRHSAGLDMLLFGETDSARNAVHLIFSGEKVKASQAAPNPAIDPVKKKMLGQDVSVVALPDLVSMKLSAYRLKDQVHVQALDAAGLITPAVEQALPEELRIRLRHVRETE